MARKNGSSKINLAYKQMHPELNINEKGQVSKPQEPIGVAIENKVRTDSEVFLSFHYNELKDLGKHFLTIVSGVLAFSVTFSEKMINFTNATYLQKTLLICSWSSLIIAVVAAGTGLYFNYIAGAQANGAIIKGNKYDFKPLVRRTYRLYEIAGGCFIAALILMVTMAALKFL